MTPSWSNLSVAHRPLQMLVLPQNRQWSHDKDMLIKHPEDQVDDFILYVKSVMVLSHVKYFNLRFRSKHYAGDPTAKIINTNSPAPHAFRYSGVNGEHIDPRQTPAFVQLDQLVTAFRASFPVHLRNPAREQVDPHLFSACTASHLYAHVHSIISMPLTTSIVPTSCYTSRMRSSAKTTVPRHAES